LTPKPLPPGLLKALAPFTLTVTEARRELGIQGVGA